MLHLASIPVLAGDKMPLCTACPKERRDSKAGETQITTCPTPIKPIEGSIGPSKEHVYAHREPRGTVREEQPWETEG